MLSWIETQLQTILTAYKTTNTTVLEKVAIFDTNSENRKFNDYLEKEHLTIVYRELPGIMPSMPVADKIITANFFVYALENEKTAVKAIIDEFIEEYNSSLQTTTSAQIRLQLTNLTPIGRANNTGSIFFQAWQFGATITIIDQLTTIFSRTVAIGSNSIGALNGLLSLNYEIAPIYADYPQSQTENKKLRYIKQRVTFTVLDSSDTDVVALKTLIYNNTTDVEITVSSNGKTASFSGKIISAIDSISEQGYPVLSFIIERG